MSWLLLSRFLLFYNRKTTYIKPPINMLEDVYSTSYPIFDLQTIQLMTRYSDSMLFKSQRVAQYSKIY